MKDPLLVRVAERFFRSLPPKRTFLEEYIRRLGLVYQVKTECFRHADGVSWVVLLHTPGYPRRFVVTPADDADSDALLRALDETLRELLGHTAAVL